ncbi:uncharacterized protein TRUGW13939_04254 [Talaromyces rugulosus]|uniref:Uncharacterized protein n=1 Tax=Talaromyces rugulosus TaxID=121627 RepID=A0A7H8QTN0_TALRU|nr:uncharacterized protein TRUGW13939_04254 [Talaromyces rugulosus]QKX57146.1 hypothetical protein TRUGW13939_04254 [Talaromyces rugulosus]
MFGPPAQKITSAQKKWKSRETSPPPSPVKEGNGSNSAENIAKGPVSSRKRARYDDSQDQQLPQQGGGETTTAAPRQAERVSLPPMAGQSALRQIDIFSRVETMKNLQIESTKRTIKSLEEAQKDLADLSSLFKLTNGYLFRLLDEWKDED